LQHSFFGGDSFLQQSISLARKNHSRFFREGPKLRVQGGGASVIGELKTLKKPYDAPSFEVLDAMVAKARLKTTPQDGNARKMMAAIEKQLAERNGSEKA
jgi:hypothetical protein